MKKTTLTGSICVIILFLGLSANAQSKLKIKSIEAATTFSSATAGNGFGGNIFGMNMSIRMRVHYSILPEGLDFSVGIHERRAHWEEAGSPKLMYTNVPSIIGIVEKVIVFEDAEDFFDKKALGRFLISLGMSYTKHLGAYWGWTNDAHILFSPIPKSKVHYDTYTRAGSDLVLQSEDVATVSNGFSPGIGLKSSIWWKMPIKSKYDFRLGFSLGYEYLNLLYPYRNFRLDGNKPLSALSPRMNHIGHVGFNFTVGL